MKTATTAAIAAAIAASGAAAQEMTFGGEEDTAYAAMLWEAMVAADLAGDGAIQAFPYEGIDPHGAMLETFYTETTVDGHAGALVVKRNYGPAGVGLDEVVGNPSEHLAAVTVMFRREDGYDPDNANWYWVKYLPDGTLDKNPAGVELAGRVGKDADAGCIACHAGAPGADYLFTTDATLD